MEGRRENKGRRSINYSLTAIGPHSSLDDAKVSIDFAKDMGDDWKVNFGVINATIQKESSILLSKQQSTRISSYILNP